MTSMLGIVNGTTNYILDEMTTKVSSSTTCSRTPRPRLRRSRPDRRHRRLRCCQQGRHHGHPRFHTSVTIDDVSVEGITKITADDITAATAEHKVIKLLAVVENGEAGVLRPRSTRP